MHEIGREELQKLSRTRSEACVSIFLPLRGLGAADKQSPIRLANLLREARRELSDRGLSEEEIESLLAPATQLAREPESWSGHRGGLALLLGGDEPVELRLPFEVAEEVSVTDRFRIRPLLPALVEPDRFFLLALSLGEVRLLEVDRAGFRRLDPPGLPRDFDQEMGYEQYDSTLGAHAASPSTLGRKGIVHGHGDADEEHFKDDVLHFFRRVAEALESVLPDADAPVIVAAVGAHHPLFRRASRTLRLDLPGIVGSPDGVEDRELAERARARVHEAAVAANEREIERWRELRASGRTLESLPEIVVAAGQGRLAQLFVAQGAERWGTLPADGSPPVEHFDRRPEDVDLIDIAVGRTLSRRGDVRVVSASLLPTGAPAIAVLRYAVAA